MSIGIQFGNLKDKLNEKKWNTTIIFDHTNVTILDFQNAFVCLPALKWYDGFPIELIIINAQWKIYQFLLVGLSNVFLVAGKYTTYAHITRVVYQITIQCLTVSHCKVFMYV